MSNVLKFCPAEMVTNGGTRAVTESVEFRMMVAPPGGAGSASMIEPVTVAPPITEVGLRAKLKSGSSVILEVSEARLKVAVNVTGCEPLTARVGIWKLADAWANGTVTIAG